MRLSNNYVLVEPLKKEQTEGFQKVEVQDNFVYKGQVCDLPESSVEVGGKELTIGDTVLFAKYSPDTHEIEGKKFVMVSDILAVV